MKRILSTLRYSSLLGLMTLVVAGCGDSGSSWSWGKEREEAPEPPPAPAVSDRALEGTVRSYGYVEGMRKLRVRGYGIVAGLPNTGGADCPDIIRRYLEREIRRISSARDLDIDPKDILDNPQYAAVVVTGDIPAAAMKNERFDLVVKSLGDQTRSLEGGRLLMCDLKPYVASPRGLIEGRTIAVAEGDVYVSPFGQSDNAATPTLPTVGRVLGGGINREDRRVRIILNSSSYVIARRIRDRLNGRFGGTEQVADAVSPTTIHLTIPTTFRGNAPRFLDLVMHTPVEANTLQLQRRAADLADDIVHPLASYEDIALVWEAIGRTSLPIVKRLYNHRVDAAAYYAARTGLRMGDDVALEVVARHAENPRSVFRTQAVSELADAAQTMHRAAVHLRTLLSDADNEIRIKSYEGLLRSRDKTIESVRIGGDNFVLDVIDCEGTPLIFIKQSDQSRVALFGRSIRLRDNVLYDHPLVMICDVPGDEELSIVRRNPVNNQLSDPLRAPRELTPLLRFLGGRINPRSGAHVDALGLQYSVIVDALYNMTTTNNSIPGALVMERPRLSDAVARTTSRERPESEF